jgi:hypothetical protein
MASAASIPTQVLRVREPEQGPSGKLRAGVVGLGKQALEDPGPRRCCDVSG